MTLLDHINRLTFGKTEQLNFLDNFFRLIADGIAMRDTLRLMSKTGSSLHKLVAQSMWKALREGRDISGCMRQWFHPVLVAAVGAAEQTDHFAETGRQLVEQQRAQSSTIGVVLGSLGTPFLYVLVGLGLYVFFAQTIFKEFDAMTGSSSWPGIAQFSYGVGLHLSGWWYVYAAGLVLFIIGMMYIFPRWTGQLRQSFDRAWPFTLYRLLCSSRVMEALGMLTVAGHEFRVALTTIQQSASPYERMYLRSMRRRLREGYSLPKTMDVRFFPEGEMQHLKMLAEYHGLREVMVRMGSAMRESALKSILRMAMPIKVVCLLIAAGSYGSLILSVYMMSSTLAGSADVATAGVGPQ